MWISDVDIPEDLIQAARVGSLSRIWIIVVGGIVLVLVRAAGFLGVAFWTDPAGDHARVTADTMLSLFTGAIGFLAGLFSPSPVSRND